MAVDLLLSHHLYIASTIKGKLCCYASPIMGLTVYRKENDQSKKCRLIIKKIAASCYLKANVTQIFIIRTNRLSSKWLFKTCLTLTVSQIKISRIRFFALRQIWPPSTIWCLYRGTQSNNWGRALKSISQITCKRKKSLGEAEKWERTQKLTRITWIEYCLSASLQQV